ncbi:MAG TPA: hypothetical protein VM577_13985, partial [Anaerovoracaceae bacterium]|nr:hypothetical protein [Anaerovoracaceae bacterium]
MINNQSEKIYNIILPNSTVNDVVEWFDLMEAKGILTTSLIELVYESIEKGNPLNGTPDSILKDFEEPQPNNTFG